jgi:hypothetical protein
MPISRATSGKVKESIEKDGLFLPTVVRRGPSQLCRERGKPLKYTFIDETNEKDMGRYVAALNQHRRSRIKPLTLEEERAKAEAAIREHPE